MEPGQLVTRYNHMLHPLFCYHHQVSDTPADVVSAHGQGKSCEQGGMKQRKAEKGKKEAEEISVKQRHTVCNSGSNSNFYITNNNLTAFKKFFHSTCFIKYKYKSSPFEVFR